MVASVVFDRFAQQPTQHVFSTCRQTLTLTTENIGFSTPKRLQNTQDSPLHLPFEKEPFNNRSHFHETSTDAHSSLDTLRAWRRFSPDSQQRCPQRKQQSTHNWQRIPRQDIRTANIPTDELHHNNNTATTAGEQNATEEISLRVP